MGVCLQVKGEQGKQNAVKGVEGSSMRSRQGVTSAGKQTKDGAVIWGLGRNPLGRLDTFRPQ